MQVSLTATGGLERRLEVAVPGAAKSRRRCEQRLKQISRTARLKGFRPGKAPFAVIKQAVRRAGARGGRRAISCAARFAEAVTQEKLRPAGGPRIEPIAVSPGTDLKYAAVFEVLPEIHVKPAGRPRRRATGGRGHRRGYRRHDREHAQAAPAFTVVDRAGAGHRSRDRRLRRHASTASSFEGGDGKDVQVVLGAGRVMPELEAGREGRQRRRAAATSASVFPARASQQAAGRQDGGVHVSTSRRSRSSRLPDVDEEFCSAFGVEEGGVEALRAEVRKSMERELDGSDPQPRAQRRCSTRCTRTTRSRCRGRWSTSRCSSCSSTWPAAHGRQDASQLPPREHVRGAGAAPRGARAADGRARAAREI